MTCLKCGKETEENRVFCQGCLQVMEKYPVKPNAQVQLPRRATPTPEKKQQKKRRTAEDTELQLRSIIRWLTVTMGILAALVCLLAAILLSAMTDLPEANPIGKNYTITDSTGGN